MPIKVILDTNIYFADKFRRGQAFKTLSSLCKSGHVEVLLPYLVRREFETQLDSAARQLVANLEKSLQLLVASPTPDDFRKEIAQLQAAIAARKDELISYHKTQFDAWRDEHGIVEVALEGEHALAAIENYFCAGPPFSAQKKRDDLPDAMVYQALLDCAKNGQITFVSNDQNLSAAASSIENVTNYSSLSEFIASPGVQELVSEGEALERAAGLIKRLQELASTVPNILVDFVAEHGGEKLANTTFASPSIPSDDREAFIYMFGALSDIEFDWDDAAYHGNHVFVVPFCGQGEFNISYYVSKWDLEDIEKRGASYTAHNDYVVEADEEAVLLVSGALRIKLSERFETRDSIADAIEELVIDSVNDPILAEDQE